MTATAVDGSPGPETAGEPPGQRQRRWRRPRFRHWIRRIERADLMVLLCYLGLAGWATVHLWRHLGHVVLVVNSGDETFFTWLFSYGAQLVVHPHNPLFSTAMNGPAGVNMMANTAMLGLTIPFAPVTLIFGPDASFALADMLALGLTAAAWYFVFSRHLVRSRFAAFIGGLACGFAPGLVAHAAGQPDLSAQFLVPFITLLVLRLAQRPVRRGVALGLLVTYQAFLNEEILYLTGVALAIFVVAYAAMTGRPSWRLARAFLHGLGIAAVVAVVLLAYPLWVQFRGPQSYHGLPFDAQGYQTDLFGYVSYARQSIAGTAGLANRISISANEDNAGFGAPMTILCVVLAAWLWRRAGTGSAHLSAVVRAAVVTAGCAILVSLGPTVRWFGSSTGIPGPYAVLRRLPLVDLAVPGRFSLIVAPVVGLLLAVGVQAISDRQRELQAAGLPVRLLGLGVLGAVLVPLLPMPLPVMGRAPVPQFITSGAWRAYLSPGQTIASVPLPGYRAPAGLYWQATTGLAYPVPRGYFLGPSAGRGSRALFGAPPRPTSTMLYAIAVSPLAPKPFIGGDTPLGRLVKDGKDAGLTEVGPAQRAAAVADLRAWHAAIVIMAPQRNEAVLVQVVTQLTGVEPIWIGGVWLWDVRSITASGQQIPDRPSG